MLTLVVPLLAYMVISLSPPCAAFSLVHSPVRLPAQRCFARLPAESFSGRALQPARPRAHPAALRMVSEFDMLTLAQVVGTDLKNPETLCPGVEKKNWEKKGGKIRVDSG